MDGDKGLALKVGLAQLKPYTANINKNLERMRDTLEKFMDRDVKLAIYPELYVMGYMSRDLIYRLAESIDGDTVSKILDLAKEYGIYIITGFAERDVKYEVIYNSALFVTPGGEVKSYRKMHLPDFSVFDEWRYFRRWDGPVETWRIDGFEIGTMICYDIFFPELARAYTYQGAKALVAISATPDFSQPLFHIIAQARAIENTTYFVWVNMVGTFEGLGFAGASRVVEPLGRVVKDMPSIKEGIDVAELDPYKVRVAREKRPILKDIHKADLENLLNSYRIDRME